MMTKIIWVTSGLVQADKLARAVEQVKSRECLIVKVPTVQEALIEIYEGKEKASLIICDRELDYSIPPRELFSAAETKEIPLLVAELDKEHHAEIIAPNDIMVPEKGPLKKFFSMIDFKRTVRPQQCQGMCVSKALAAH